MSVDEIKSAISKLSLEERESLARWLHGWTDDEWDQQISRDAMNGKLDKLLAEVDEEIEHDRLRELP